MKLLSSNVIQEVHIVDQISSKKSLKICLANIKLRFKFEYQIAVLKMYRKDKIINHEHVWNERRVLEHIRDSQTITDDERLHLPHLYDTLVLQDDKNNDIYICFAIKYIQGYTLDKYLNVEFSMDLSKKIFIQIAKSIGVLHRENIIHRDIKCNNIIIENKIGNVVLIDMGLACYINHNQRLNEFCGSFHCMAPEMLCIKQPSYNMNYDWWSFGVLVYEFLFKNPPFGYHPEENNYLLNKMKNSPNSLKFPELENNNSNENTINDFSLMCGFIKSLLDINETNRLGNKEDYFEVLNHPWLKNDQNIEQNDIPIPNPI